MDARLRGEPLDELADSSQVFGGSHVQRVVFVGVLEHHVDERATLEAGGAEPGVEHIEDRQQLLARSLGAPRGLGLQPVTRPHLFAPGQKCEHQILL